MRILIITQVVRINNVSLEDNIPNMIISKRFHLKDLITKRILMGYHTISHS